MFAYQVRGRGTHVLSGVTRPIRGRIAAVLKSDGTEIPTCVYNELVASRLGALIGLPAASGVLAQGKHAYEYASLLAATPGGRLPPIFKPRAQRAAIRYPDECAAVFAFDLFIGNWDRGGNIKAALATPTSFFCAFDHSHTLLALERTPEASIEALSDRDPRRWLNHIFRELVVPTKVQDWVRKIEHISDEYIALCCSPGEPINEVTVANQEALARALQLRKGFLGDLVSEVLSGVPV
jgi:hypothetical protein